MISALTMSRYQFLFEGLTEVSEKEALVGELSHFKAGPSAGQVGADSTLLQAYMHSVHCLEYEDNIYRKVHTELTHAFSWHLSAKGEDYWQRVYERYLLLDRQEKKNRIAAQAKQMAESDAEIESAKTIVSEINEITMMASNDYEKMRLKLLAETEAAKALHEKALAAERELDDVDANQKAAKRVPPLAEDAPDEQ
jgi:paraquat-inducible protein B